MARAFAHWRRASHYPEAWVSRVTANLATIDLLRRAARAQLMEPPSRPTTTAVWWQLELEARVGAALRTSLVVRGARSVVRCLTLLHLRGPGGRRARSARGGGDGREAARPVRPGLAEEPGSSWPSPFRPCTAGGAMDLRHLDTPSGSASAMSRVRAAASATERRRAAPGGRAWS